MFNLIRQVILLPLVVALIGTSTGCSKAARADRHLQKADEYYAAGKLSEAEIEYLNVGSSRVDLQACKLEYSIVSPK